MPEPLYHAALPAYLDSLVPERNAVMQEMEQRARETNFPIIGTAAGYSLYQIARMVKANSVFELGSGYGYSTSWFCKAVQENGGGVVHHVVWHEDLSSDARTYLTRMGYSDLVKFHCGEAVEALKSTPGTFDVIFNDIDKIGYPASIPIIKEKLNPGGVLMIDNMLWHGRLFDSSDHSAESEAIKETTKMLISDPDFITTLLPIRDGVIVAFRK